jgi:hypothetical protein
MSIIRGQMTEVQGHRHRYGHGHGTVHFLVYGVLLMLNARYRVCQVADREG